MFWQKNKIKIIASFCFFVFLFFFFLVFSRAYIYEKHELEYGVTFSKKQANDLKLDWKKTYLDALVNLKVRKLRLPAYWKEVEANNGVYDWNDLDWQINTAAEHNADIILAVGGRLPRWPECHWPDWASKINDSEREQKILDYIEATILRYKDYKNISAWQIENEPFLDNFGECPELNVDFFDKEIALARSLDSRPVVITDSGELSIWVPAARRADIFGTTMYRDTFSSELGIYIHYPIGPWFFKIKKNITSLFASPKKWVVIELAAEPWCQIEYQYATKTERDKTMNLEKFKDNIEFARQTGFKEFYLWGVEWWYWEKETQNNPELWDEAKKLYGRTEVAY